MRWAMTSVSVWLAKTKPWASRSRRRYAWFSITPLCTTATLTAPARPPRCGWAFRSVAGPWVAHRVWLIPHPPGAGSRSSNSSRARTLPARFRTMSRPASIEARPALS